MEGAAKREWIRPTQLKIMKNFIDLFSGLQRAHGCTYVEKKNADGTKIKGKSFVKT